MASQTLLRTHELTVGDFLCPPGDPLWSEVNTNMGAWPHVVFPRTHVLIAQGGARPTLTTPNHVVFYKPHQLYRRSLRDPRGDRSLWLEVSPALLEDAARLGPARPCDARTYLLAVGLSSHLADASSPDRLLAEEGALRLLELALGGPEPRARGRRARTRGEHAELAEAAKELLAQRMAERPSLAEIHRRLAEHDPAAYEPALAKSLVHLSFDVDEVGRREEAIDAMQDAVGLYRRLAADNSAAYELDLASVLKHLSLRLAEAGRREDSLNAVQEAVSIRRRLAQSNPAAYEPDLALTLNNLSLRLAEAGRDADAAQAHQEAAALER